VKVLNPPSLAARQGVFTLGASFHNLSCYILQLGIASIGPVAKM